MAHWNINRNIQHVQSEARVHKTCNMAHWNIIEMYNLKQEFIIKHVIMAHKNS